MKLVKESLDLSSKKILKLTIGQLIEISKINKDIPVFIEKDELAKQIWKSIGYNTATGKEIRLPYKDEVPISKRKDVEILLRILNGGELPIWW